MSARLLTFPASRQLAPPRLKDSGPTPAVVLSFVSGQHRVSVLWGTGGGVFPDYDKASRYAARLSAQNGWPLVNLARGAA